MTVTITYAWSIAQLEAAPSEEGLTNVVKTIHWCLNAEDSDGYKAGSYGSVGLESPEAAGFVEYEDLTQELIEGWLEEKLDGDSLRAGLSANIESQKNPPIVTLPLPWSS